MRGSALILVGLASLAVVVGLMLVRSSDNMPRDDEGPLTAAGEDITADGDSSGGQQTTTSIGDEPVIDDEAARIAQAVEEAEASPDAEALTSLAAWPTPAVSLLVTGEMHGYFEPCGCTANQLGGMSRRADLAGRLEALGWPVRGLDLGGLPRRTSVQARYKFETTLRALRELQYLAVSLAPEDLLLQPDYLLSQHVPDGDRGLAFLCANVVFYGSPELGTPLPSLITEQNGVRIGITAVLGESLKKEVIPESASPDEFADLSWKSPAETLPAVMDKFAEEDVSIRILLSQCSPDETESLIAAFPDFDIVVAAQGPEDPDAEPKQIGSTLVLNVGRKGKHAGVLGLYPDTEKPEDRIRYQLVGLTREKFDDTESMIRLMQDYQTRLKDDRIALQDGDVPHPSGATYIGSSACGECHTTAYEIWKDSGHAHAFESLDPSHKRLGYERLNGVLRTFDPECLSCHVTGWNPGEYFRYETGFVNEEFASSPEQQKLQALLGGSGCENCHGPGSEHVALMDEGDTEAAAAQVRVTLKQAKEKLCYTCHDLDNSPEFEFDSYWEKVKHYGVD